MKFLVAICLIYLSLNAALYVFQRSLQYFPDATFISPEDAGLAGFKTIEMTAQDGVGLIGWYAPAKGAAATIVYLQGNAQGLAARAERFDLFNQHGYGVLALGYRGYSGSSGQPTEHGLLQDGRAALSYLESIGVPKDKTVLYGESLGSGVAVQLAADSTTSPGAVILEAPFTSAADVAKKQYWYVPVTLLMTDQFRSIDHAAHVTSPVFVLHGDADRIVPFEHGKKLFAAITAPKEFMPIAGGGHIDDLTLAIWQRMNKFMKTHLGPVGN